MSLFGARIYVTAIDDVLTKQYIRNNIYSIMC